MAAVIASSSSSWRLAGKAHTRASSDKFKVKYVVCLSSWSEMGRSSPAIRERYTLRSPLNSCRTRSGLTLHA
ncbi:MAG: hypothetical protein ACPIOQ_84590, partial [Promethearchaeia archaeon]